MGFVSASNGGHVISGTVFWTDLPSLAPGQIVTLALQLRLDVVTLTQYRNVAEITADGSATYSTPTVTVADGDSHPDDNPNNDPVVDVSNVNIDSTPGDEDDHDIAMLDTAQITSDNSAPDLPPTLPVTGAQIATLLLAAMASLASGGLLSSRRVRRRRR
jgi:LPXTG-motif cell wall-anchored protein